MDDDTSTIPRCNRNMKNKNLLMIPTVLFENYVIAVVVFCKKSLEKKQ